MKTKIKVSHTPGPWESTKVPTQIGRAFKIDRRGLRRDHGVIACIYDDSTTLNETPHEEHEANAHLIAAAPELLEACKAADEISWSNEFPQRISDLLKAAISKAEGGSNA